MNFKAPESIPANIYSGRNLFLAGTIDMGDSENWQDYATKKLESHFHIFNPRRDDWDTSWGQTTADPRFKEQVQWEIDRLWESDVILFHFADNSQSPITLLELGMFVGSDRKVVVSCSEKYFRYGNVKFVCDYYDRPLLNNLDSALEYIIDGCN